MTAKESLKNLTGYDKGTKNFEQMRMFKGAVSDAMDDASNFDKTIVESNDVYLSKLQDADSKEMEILELNMEKADTAEERELIRNRMAEMQKARYEKDSENKQFFEKQQENHRNHNMKLLGALAVATGLVYKFRKPILTGAKNLLTKQ